MEKDVTGDNCPPQFTTIEQAILHWVALVGVTICDGQSSAWPCEPDDPTPREYWKFKNSWDELKFDQTPPTPHTPLAYQPPDMRRNMPSDTSTWNGKIRLGIQSIRAACSPVTDTTWAVLWCHQSTA